MNPGSNPFARIFAIILLLSGCASAPHHLTEHSKSAIKNVAVVSLVPEIVNFDKIAIFSSSNTYTRFDMGGKVADSILYVSRARIAKSDPGWTIKKIEYDQAALLASLNTPSGFNGAKAKEAFAGLARKNDLDAIFVVRAAADKADGMQQEHQAYYLGEGMNVLLKNNNLGGNPKLVFRANLSVTVMGKNGGVMAVGSIPAQLDHVNELDPDDYGVSLDMKHNFHPATLDRLGRGVIVDLARRLNLCLDDLGFVEGSNPETRHIQVAPQPDVASQPKPAAQAAPASNSFDLCFSRCRQYTDRTKDQCFDACNK
ncbi:MAG: hypothetical protein LJE57_09340 [Gallionella sp.]|nr:hypothetical protein [Gallionella sp.]